MTMDNEQFRGVRPASAGPYLPVHSMSENFCKHNHYDSLRYAKSLLLSTDVS